LRFEFKITLKKQKSPEPMLSKLPEAKTQ